MRPLWWPVAATSIACVPTFEEDTSLIDGPRVLAVQSEPAEAEEGASVLLSALVAVPEPAETSASAAFYLCNARKPLSELGPIAAGCLDTDATQSASALTFIGRGDPVVLEVPAKACSSFGPRPPEPEPGQPPGRPIDPDLTGGYYQPVIARVPGADQVLGGVRLSCGLPDAPRDLVVAYNQAYTPNANPTILRVELRAEDEWQQIDAVTGGPAAATRVQRGTAVEFRITAGALERYSRPNTRATRLLRATEQLSVSWFATAGTFESAHSLAEPSADEADRARASVEWLSPDRAGPVRLWFVVRDGRGGVGWSATQIEVE